MALVAPPSLYYPPRVRKELRRFHPRHVRRGIGWILGTERTIGPNTWWFILNVQSDAMSAHLTSLREIFRGWQRVLFFLSLVLAAHKNVSFIAIPSAASVYRASGAYYPRRPNHAEHWSALYEGVADFFGLTFRKIERRVNLQTMRRGSSLECNEFFVGNISEIFQSNKWLAGC